MTTPEHHQHPGDERWEIHCLDPHPCPGCWCDETRQAVRRELTRLITASVSPARASMVADRLLTAGTLRIELRHE